MHFVFLTRCTRPENITKVEESVASVFKNTEHTYKHIVIMSSEDSNSLFERNCNVSFMIFNNSYEDKKNYFMKSMDACIAEIEDNAYIYVLDDDNILHFKFLDVCSEINDEDAVVFQVEGKRTWGKSNLTPDTAVGNIDWANFITKAKVMKELKVYNEEDVSSHCDGVFFRKLLMNGYKIKYTPKTLAYYNRLNK